MKRYASNNGLSENENVCWSGDMVQTMIRSIASASYGEHNDLSELLCDDAVTPKNPTNIMQVHGEQDVQMVTLVPSDVENNSTITINIVWYGYIDNKKVKVTRITTGAFDFHVQGQLLQKHTMHKVLVASCVYRQEQKDERSNVIMLHPSVPKNKRRETRMTNDSWCTRM